MTGYGIGGRHELTDVVIRGARCAGFGEPGFGSSIYVLVYHFDAPVRADGFG